MMLVNNSTAPHFVPSLDISLIETPLHFTIPRNRSLPSNRLSHQEAESRHKSYQIIFFLLIITIIAIMSHFLSLPLGAHKNKVLNHLSNF